MPGRSGVADGGEAEQRGATGGGLVHRHRVESGRRKARGGSGLGQGRAQGHQGELQGPGTLFSLLVCFGADGLGDQNINKSFTLSKGPFNLQLS